MATRESRPTCAADATIWQTTRKSSQGEEEEERGLEEEGREGGREEVGRARVEGGRCLSQDGRMVPRLVAGIFFTTISKK